MRSGCWKSPETFDQLHCMLVVELYPVCTPYKVVPRRGATTKQKHRSKDNLFVADDNLETQAYTHNRRTVSGTCPHLTLTSVPPIVTEESDRRELHLPGNELVVDPTKAGRVRVQLKTRFHTLVFCSLVRELEPSPPSTRKGV